MDFNELDLTHSVCVRAKHVGVGHRRLEFAKQKLDTASSHLSALDAQEQVMLANLTQLLSLRELLTQLRVDSGVSHHLLAKRTGLPINQIQRAEQDLISLSLEELLILLMGLGIAVTLDVDPARSWNSQYQARESDLVANLAADSSRANFVQSL